MVPSTSADLNYVPPLLALMAGRVFEPARAGSVVSSATSVAGLAWSWLRVSRFCSVPSCLRAGADSLYHLHTFARAPQLLEVLGSCFLAMRDLHRFR